MSRKLPLPLRSLRAKIKSWSKPKKPYSYRSLVLVAVGVSFGVLLLGAGIIWLLRVTVGKTWGDVASLGQLVLDAIMVPVTIIGFAVAWREFVKAQAEPDLDLYLATEAGQNKTVTVSISAHTRPTRTVQLVLLNSGRDVAVWYMLDFRVQAALTPQLYPRYMDRLKRIGTGVGKPEENWKMALHQSDQSLLATFMSNGQVAAYPNYGLNLAELQIHVPPDCAPGQYHVPYTIATSWGQRRDSHLTIIIVK